MADVALWEQWVVKPQVKETWFIEGYLSPDCIYEKLAGNGYDYPYIIQVDDKPIGYIQCTDLYTYRMVATELVGVFRQEDPGTYGIDLFIGEEDFLDKGYGTKIIKAFVQKILKELPAKQIVIDPEVSNKRAIRCYEKAGFKFVKIANNGIKDCYVMRFEQE